MKEEREKFRREDEEIPPPESEKKNVYNSIFLSNLRNPFLI